MLLAAAVALITPPQPLFMDSWFSPAIDIPRRGLKSDQMTAMAIELTVAKNGNAIGCRARVVAGNPNMGPYTCSRLLSRALFRPARNADSSKTNGVFRTSVAWWIGNNTPPKFENPAFAEFRVKNLAAAQTSPADVELAFAVDVTGNVTACMSNDKKQDMQLVQIACSRLEHSSVGPALDKKQRPLPSVQTGRIRLRRE